MTSPIFRMLRASVSVAAIILACSGLLAAPPSGGQPEMVLQLGLQNVGSMAISADHRVLTSVSYRGELAVTDPRTGKLMWTERVAGDREPSLAISPDSKVIALSSTDLVGVRLYDIATRKVVSLPGRGGPADSVAFSPDGKTLAVGADRDRVSLWDYRAKRLLRSISLHLSGHARMLIAFSRDGSLLATGGTGSGAASFDHGTSLEVWRVSTGILAGVIEASGDIHSAAFSPDGKIVAVGMGNWKNADPVAEFRDVATGGLVKRFTASDSDEVGALAFSPDGSLLIGLDAYGALDRWDTRTGKLLAGLPEGDTEKKVCLSSDAALAAMCGDTGEISLTSTASHTTIRTIPGNPVVFDTAVFSDDGESLYQKGRCDGARLITERDTRTGRLKSAMVDGRMVPGGMHSGRHPLFTMPTDNGDMTIWDMTAGTVRTMVKNDSFHYIQVEAVSPDQSLFAVAGRLEKPGPAERSRPPYPGQVWPNWPLLLEIYNVRTGRLVWSRITPVNTYEDYSGLRFTPDGKTLISVRGDGVIDLWNVAGGAIRREIDPHRQAGLVAVSGDGALVAISADNSINVYSCHTGGLILSAARGLLIASLDLSRDGRRLAAYSYDGFARIWEVPSGRKLREFHPDLHGMRVIFSPDHRIVACVDPGGTVQLWDAATGKERAAFLFFGASGDGARSIGWLTCTPAGYYDGSPNVERFLDWRAEGKLVDGPSAAAEMRKPQMVRAALSGVSQPVSYAPPAVPDITRSLLRAVNGSIASKKHGGRPELKPSAARLRDDLTINDMLFFAGIRKYVKERVESDLAAGADPNTLGGWDNTALMIFSAAGDVANVKKLIAHKVNLNIEDVHGDTALILAASQGNDEIVHLLLDAGADFKDASGRSYFWLRGRSAALGAELLNDFDSRSNRDIGNRLGRAYLFLLLGADANAQDAYAETALLRASKFGEAFAVRLLLEHGADATHDDKGGFTPILYAADNRDKARLLLAHGANPNPAVAEGYRSETPLISAVRGRCLACAEELIAHGANVNRYAANTDLPNALFHAVHNLDATMVRLLLAHGAVATVHTSDGKTVLDMDEELDPWDHYGIHAILKEAAQKAPVGVAD